MKKSASQDARDASTPMTTPSSASSTRVRSARRSTTSTPRWVKVSVVIIIVLVLLFVVLHLTGHGFGDHMHMSAIEHGGATAMIMSPGLRKVALTAHVTSSIGWFGAVAVFLALALVGLTSQDAQLVRATYLVMGLTTWFVIVPLAFASLLTGVVSSLGTRWGLFRYYWVLMKLIITLVAAVVLMIHTQTIERLSGAAAKSAVLGANLSGAQLNMLVASGLALVVLLVLTVISVYKPRGMTGYGQRKQDEHRQGIVAEDGANDQGLEGNDVHAATIQ